jgi:hypothetical protein
MGEKKRSARMRQRERAGVMNEVEGGMRERGSVSEIGNA